MTFLTKILTRLKIVVENLKIIYFLNSVLPIVRIIKVAQDNSDSPLCCTSYVEYNVHGYPMFV